MKMTFSKDQIELCKYVGKERYEYCRRMGIGGFKDFRKRGILENEALACYGEYAAACMLHLPPPFSHDNIAKVDFILRENKRLDIKSTDKSFHNLVAKREAVIRHPADLYALFLWQEPVCEAIGYALSDELVSRENLVIPDPVVEKDGTIIQLPDYYLLNKGLLRPFEDLVNFQLNQNFPL